MSRAGMSGQSYDTNDIVYRITTQNSALFAAGTYKRGQPVGRDNTTGAYTAYDENATNGAEKISGVVINDMIIPTGGGHGIIAFGEFDRTGVARVMASLTPPITLTDVLVGRCNDAGIILN